MDNEENLEELKQDIVLCLKEIYDPEIPVNIYDLGLIYSVDVTDKKLSIVMTLTSPHCPVADSIVQRVQDSLLSLENIESVHVDLTFEPPWTKDMMSDDAKMILGFF